MSSVKFFGRAGMSMLAFAAIAVSPSLFAQSSSSADYANQSYSSSTLPQDLQYRAQYQNQYPSGGGYHQRRMDSSFSHLAFEAGIGASVPIGTQQALVESVVGVPGTSGVPPYNSNINLNSTGVSFLLGAGYNFNRHFGAMLEYHFEDPSVNGTVNNALYQELGGSVAQNGVNGNSHIWSFTLNPVYNFKTSGHWGGYVTGGGGFYRILTSFNTPVLQYYESYFGLVPGEGNALLYHFSSNQGGVEGGGGVTWKPNPDQHGALFADVRYEWINSPTNTTKLIPITFGYRW